jgi:hypothetical protein
MYEIVIGGVEQDLFDHPGPGHRTYPATDGHHHTGVDSWDALHACSSGCRDALTDDYPIRSIEPVHDAGRICDAYVFDHGHGRFHDACVYELDAAGIEDHRLPIICDDCDSVMVGPIPPSSDHPDPANYTLTVTYDNGHQDDHPFTALDAAIAHAVTIARSDAGRHPAIVLATGPDYLGPPWQRDFPTPT